LGIPARRRQHSRVTGILHGARAITGDTALRLAHYFGTSAEFWMNLQQHYELRLAAQEIGAEIKSIPRRKTRAGDEIHSPAA